ncbi:MAG: helix-turn-helix transcriptional regulator [Parafilimonas terrae]|nr:helix-turn-helix transcriptional regulator [Parafilimonas terrae]
MRPLDDHNPKIVTLAEDIGALIDRAAFDPDAWEDVMAAFAAAVPGGKTGIQVVDILGESAVPLTSAGWPEGAVAQYAAYYNAINPWMPVMLAAPAMQPIYSERLLPASAFAHTEFYTDWLARAGGADASSGMRIAESDGRLGFISLHYDVRRADSANGIYEPLLKILGPRIRRTLDASRHTGPRRLRSSLLDALVEPAFLVAQDMRIYGANEAAEALLRDGKILRCGHLNNLDVRDRNLLASIRSAVATTCAPGTALGPFSAAPAITTAFGTFAACTMTVDPKFLSAGRLGLLVLPPKLALLVLRRCPRPRKSADLQQTLIKDYRLTAAEARLAAILDGTVSLKEAADRFGITVDTARTQLRAVFRKTGVSRQAELTRLVLLRSGRGR